MNALNPLSQQTRRAIIRFEPVYQAVVPFNISELKKQKPHTVFEAGKHFVILAEEKSPLELHIDTLGEAIAQKARDSGIEVTYSFNSAPASMARNMDQAAFGFEFADAESIAKFREFIRSDMYDLWNICPSLSPEVNTNSQVKLIVDANEIRVPQGVKKREAYENIATEIGRVPGIEMASFQYPYDDPPKKIHVKWPWAQNRPAAKEEVKIVITVKSQKSMELLTELLSQLMAEKSESRGL